MSTAASRARQQGGVRQFPVGRRRYVPVVDAGCGCRPARLLSLPSFLKSGSCHLVGGGKAAAARRSGGGGEHYHSSSSTSTASFSSSSCAATHSYSSSAYSSSDYHHHYAYGAATKHQAVHHNHKAKAAASPARAPPEAKKKKKTTTNKNRQVKKMEEEAEEGGVGVAVEKESCDPRADFRESMVQMVVEMGLCDWDGLRCMLRRLLALNAPRHHAAILTAFAEVCAQIIAAPAAASPTPSPSPSPKTGYRQYRRS